MTSPDGAFYSALDADSEHEEGKFYVWTPKQVSALLTAEEYAVARPCWGLDANPNFEDHAWHLCVERPLAKVAEQLGLGPDEAAARLESARRKLFEAREIRIRPGRDDKVLTSWNALMIKGLARAARRFDRPDWLALAQAAADALRRLVWRDGRLAATYQQDRARHNGYLDDTAFLLDALLELLQAEWRGADLRWARELADALLARFEDTEAGGFFFTSHDHEKLIHRTKPAHDNATPSGNGVAAVVLGRLGLLLDEPRYHKAAERTLRLFQSAMVESPSPYPSLLTALAEYLASPRLIVLRGPEPELSEWKRIANKSAGIHDLLFKLTSDAQDIPTNLHKTIKNTVNAYVCDGVNCLPEIVQIHDLTAIFSDWTVQ
jgi:uncharacterized protein YyaL (SSP411 family)